MLRKAVTLVLAAAVLTTPAGCGSRASDQEIVEALRGPAAGNGAQLSPGSATDPTSAGGAVVDPAVGGGAPTAGSPAVAAPAAGGSTPAVPGGTNKPGSQGTQPATAPATKNSAPKVADKSVVTFGQLGSFSGVLGAVTAGAPRSVAAWVANQNDHGGLNGHPIKVIVADDQGDPATALTLAKRLVESDKVLAFVGDVHFFGFEQVEAYMRSKNVPMIGGEGATETRFTSPVNFPVSAPGAVQIVKGLKMYVERGATKMGMLYCLEISALCSYLNDQVKKSEVGKYVVQSYQVSLVAPSYTSQCLRMKQGGLEVIYMLMDTAGAARLVKDCANQGFTPKLLLLGLDATKEMPSIPVLSEALMPGATVSTGARDLASVNQFHKVIQTYAPSVGESGFGTQAYAGAMMLGHVGRNLSDNPTSAELLAALYKVRNETLGGFIVPVSYSKQGTTAAPCVFIWGVANGRFTAPEGSKPLC